MGLKDSVSAESILFGTKSKPKVVAVRSNCCWNANLTQNWYEPSRKKIAISQLL